MTTELSPMQKEMLSRADNIFNSISETVSKATAFAQDQIPDIAYQYVAFGRAHMTILMVLSVVAFAVALYLFFKFIFVKEHTPNGGVEVAAFISGAGFAVAGGIIFFTNLTQFLMVWFAPKIWLIQSIVNLVKS